MGMLLGVENRTVPHGGQGTLKQPKRSRRTTAEEIKMRDKQEATEHFNESLLLVSFF